MQFLKVLFATAVVAGCSNAAVPAARPPAKDTQRSANCSRPRNGCRSSVYPPCRNLNSTARSRHLLTE